MLYRLIGLGVNDDVRDVAEREETCCEEHASGKNHARIASGAPRGERSAC
jgi:hypothetical protein